MVRKVIKPMLEAFSAYLVSIGIKPTFLFAGAAGAIVRTMLAKGRSMWEILSGVMIGTLSAIYITPVVITWLNIDVSSLDNTNGIAFGIGMIGMSLAEGAVRLAQRWASNPRLPTDLTMKGFADATVPEHDRKAERRQRRDEP